MGEGDSKILGFPPYYFRQIRKNVVAFGSLFENLIMIKYKNDYEGVEQSRITVPLFYSDKEDYIIRILDNPELAKPVQVQLPRMSYRITNYKYDSERQFNTFTSNFNVQNTNSAVLTQWQAQPIDIDFELNLYVRNVEDGTQLIEQIVPFFKPQDLTIAINFIPSMGISKNVPIILNSIISRTEYEGNATEAVRYITWTLSFTMKSWMFGPVIDGGIITEVIERIWSYTNGPASQIELFLQTPILGNYQMGEIVYQGQNLPDANIQGNVAYWDSNSGRMLVNVVTGSFVVDVNVQGTLSGASGACINTTNNILLANIVTTPIPNNASNAQTAYGWSISVTEYPETI
ncbi:MAG: tail sheath stabilizer and completion protein [Rhabdochlamydiaceae bacterium]